MTSNQIYNNPIQSTYQAALDRIYRYTGLELTLIEKVHLRRIAAEAVDRLGTAQSIYNRFSPVTDTVAIFLRDFYDTPALSQADVTFLIDLHDDLEDKLGYDALSEFYQRRQEEYHTLERKE